MSGNKKIAQRQFAEQMLYQAQFHLLIILLDIVTATAYRVCSIGGLMRILKGGGWSSA